MRRGQLFSSAIRLGQGQINREIFHFELTLVPNAAAYICWWDWQSHQQGHMRGPKRVMPREPSLNDA